MDVQDLSEEATYTLDVNATQSKATLTITTKDNAIAERVAESISGVQGTSSSNDKVVTVDILKKVE